MFRNTALSLLFLNLLAVVCWAQIEIGEKAPDFSLFGVDYRYHRLSEYLARPATKAVVVVFTCNHCPYSVPYEDKLIELAGKYQPQGLPFLAVNPNPADMVAPDGFPRMIERSRQKGFPFPYVSDETQATARACGDAHTPEIFLVEKDGNVFYTGGVDNSGKEPWYLANAMEDVLAGRPVKNSKSQAVGCTVKYRR